jgi:hypothetical protein
VTDAFLLGAGFSRAVSEHMPLLNELGDQIPFRSEEFRPALLSANFEKMLTYFAERQPWLNEETNLRNRATFLDISRRISSVLLRRQTDALQQPMPNWLHGLVERWIGQGTWVITLNYDTLIEKCLTEHVRRTSEPRLGAIFAHSGLYPVPIQSALGRFQLVLGEQAKAPFSYLKLHGSLNWRYSGGESPQETIYDIGVTPGWNSDPLPDQAERSAIDKVPLVVPPTLSKSSFFVNETVRSIWRLAGIGLERADNVYCLGYSLPESDHTMIGLLRDSIRESATVFVVNRDAGAAARFEKMLSPLGKVSAGFAGGDDCIPRFTQQYAQTSRG